MDSEREIPLHILFILFILSRLHSVTGTKNHYSLFFPSALTFAQRALCAAASAALWAALNFPLRFGAPSPLAALALAQRAAAPRRALAAKDIFFRPRRFGISGAADPPPAAIVSISP